jgi:protein tyrosine phosphatase (PTP) superfamily phosphohydrolase (DUF442 family)
MVSAGVSVRFRNFLFQGNVGVVEPGRLYRSAQPRANLEALVREHRLGSILNLRGGSERNDWYVAEVETADRLGVEFYDFPMSAVRRPRRQDLLAILDVLERCRYPLLIHCKSGSDRTGFAVGLYLMAHRSEPPLRAISAFTLDHGHVPLLGPERLHEPFREYAQYLRSAGLEHSPSRLRAWVENEYVAEDRLSDARPVEPGSRLGRAPERRNR